MTNLIFLELGHYTVVDVVGQQVVNDHLFRVVNALSDKTNYGASFFSNELEPTGRNVTKNPMES